MTPAERQQRCDGTALGLTMRRSRVLVYRQAGVDRTFQVVVGGAQADADDVARDRRRNHQCHAAL